MAYNELIKSFEKIRDYMREFYVYGFKSREDYTKKSARSYDDERRRIESWLGGYMAFRHTAEGKNVFISVDNRSVTFNPLHNAWKAKSFTDKDIVLHFCILDILADGTAQGVSEISDRVADYLSHTDTPFEVDESTVRKKLKEYTELGIIRSEKAGRSLLYRIADSNVDVPSWEDAAAFFSEEAPFGAVGSYHLRHNRYLCSVPPIVSNMLIIPFILTYAYHIPGGMPYFMVTVGIGEMISCMVLGQILLTALKPFKGRVFRMDEE